MLQVRFFKSFKKLSFILIILSLTPFSAQAAETTLELGFNTINKYVTKGEPLHFQAELGVTQLFKEHYYYSVSATWPKDKSYDIELDLGYQFEVNRFTPYLQIEFVRNHDSDDTDYIVGYEFGSAYEISKHFSASLGVNSLFISDDLLAEIGLELKLNQLFSLEVKGSQFLKHSGNGVSLKAAIGFS